MDNSIARSTHSPEKQREAFIARLKGPAELKPIPFSVPAAGRASGRP
jgi:hypothetical protein